MRILYPTDFSEASLNAFLYALELARATTGSVITFHAYDLPDIRGASLPNTLRAVYDSISLEEFENYKDNVPILRKIAAEQNAADVPLKHVLQHGDPRKIILNAITANNVDLVVMGSTGSGMMKELFVGSVAAEIMENASVPVLTVPEEATYRDVTRIAFASELLVEDDDEMTRAKEISDAFGAEMVCIYADISHTSDLSDKVRKFKERHQDVELHVLDTIDVEKSVAAFIRKQQIDVLAMIIHKRNRIQEMFNYSLTKRFAKRLKVPILAIQADVATSGNAR